VPDPADLLAVTRLLLNSGAAPPSDVQLWRDAVSQDMRSFANAFPVLQDVRHLADYDPTAFFQQSDVASLIDATEVAMADFDRAAPEEQTDVLVLIMVKSKG
jgi:hypothetical protein